MFEKAKHTELDQWLSSEAVVPVLKGGVPLSRIMKMSWVLTWKTPPAEFGETEKRAKARLVVLGYTDPDLTEVARDSPTLALRTGLMLFAICAAERWTLYKGDIKNVLLEGGKAEIG